MVVRDADYSEYAAPFNRINWGAIIGGTIIGILFQILLSLLGIAIGLTVVDAGDRVGSGFAIGTGIYMIIATVISVFIGAFATGRFTGTASRYDSMLHGVATMALITIVILFTIGIGVSKMIGGAFTYGLQAANTPQFQQMMPSPKQITGAAANIPPQQQRQWQQQADKVATSTSWMAFLTGVFSLIAAAIGGLLGMRSRTRTEKSNITY